MNGEPARQTKQTVRPGDKATEPGDDGQAVGSVAIEASVFITSDLSSQNSLHNRLWRVLFDPPALLGVIGCGGLAPSWVMRRRTNSHRANGAFMFG
jgi:hypothetical protein